MAAVESAEPLQEQVCSLLLGASHSTASSCTVNGNRLVLFETPADRKIAGQILQYRKDTFLYSTYVLCSVHYMHVHFVQKNTKELTIVITNLSPCLYKYAFN